MKTKYKPQATATSNPKQGKQNAPGCLITYGQLQSKTSQKQGKYRRCKQIQAESNPIQVNPIKNKNPGVRSHTGKNQI
jgi:hypothetical protein